MHTREDGGTVQQTGSLSASVMFLLMWKAEDLETLVWKMQSPQVAYCKDGAWEKRCWLHVQVQQDAIKAQCSPPMSLIRYFWQMIIKSWLRGTTVWLLQMGHLDSSKSRSSNALIPPAAHTCFAGPGYRGSAQAQFRPPPHLALRSPAAPARVPWLWSPGVVEAIGCDKSFGSASLPWNASLKCSVPGNWMTRWHTFQEGRLACQGISKMLFHNFILLGTGQKWWVDHNS